MKRTLAIVILALFAATLISVAILLAQVVSSLLIVLAIVVLLAVFGVGAGILITTNTRPWASNDPFAATADELLRPPLLRTEERRVKPGTVDDRMLTLQRITDMVEDAAALRPLSERTSGLFSDDEPTDRFKDPPREDAAP